MKTPSRARPRARKPKASLNGHADAASPAFLKRQAAALQVLGCAMALLDKKGGIIYLNSALARLHGFKEPQPLLGRSLGALFPAEEVERFRKVMIPACRKTGRWQGAATGQRRDLSRFPLEISLAAIPGGDLVYAAQDVSERLAAEEEREKLLRLEQAARLEAEKVVRAKDDFLAVISHELRTPLTAMLGWTLLLREGAIKSDQQKRALDIIERNMKAQAQIIEDMLDVSRFTTGKLRFEMEPSDLASIVRASVDSIRPQVQDRSLSLETTIPEAEVLVVSDPERLQQVFWNLLSNAIKFTPAGGVIRVALSHDAVCAQVSVSDTGKGIGADFLPYVFDRFRQEESSLTRSHRGLGLGLAIVRFITEEHGGHVRVESEGHGRGATFTVTLPLAPAGTKATPVDA